MDNKKDIERFFGDPFAAELINCNDSLIRRSVTGISASCEMLSKLAEKKGMKQERGYIDNIMRMCCDLMRSAELSNALAAGKLAADDMIIVRADFFLGDFAGSCEAASRGRCTVTVGETSPSYFRTDRELLRFLLLSFVRRLTVGGDGGRNAFEVSCREELKTLNISVKALRTFVDEGLIGQPDVFDEHYREVCAGLAERLGASAEISDNELVVGIPLHDGSRGGLTEAPSAEPERDYFNSFSIMLGNM